LLGWSPKFVVERLGDVLITTTMDTCCRVFPQEAGVGESPIRRATRFACGPKCPHGFTDRSTGSLRRARGGSFCQLTRYRLTKYPKTMNASPATAEMRILRNHFRASASSLTQCGV
jgi:hypothetical protein